MNKGSKQIHHVVAVLMVNSQDKILDEFKKNHVREVNKENFEYKRNIIIDNNKTISCTRLLFINE